MFPAVLFTTVVIPRPLAAELTAELLCLVSQTDPNNFMVAVMGQFHTYSSVGYGTKILILAPKIVEWFGSPVCDGISVFIPSKSLDGKILFWLTEQPDHSDKQLLVKSGR